MLLLDLGPILIRCGAADVGLQVVRIGMDTDSMFRYNTNDVRGVKGEQQRTYNRSLWNTIQQFPRGRFIAAKCYDLFPV